MSECSGRTTTAVAPAARSAIKAVADASARFATALAVAVLSSGPGSSRRRGGLDDAGHVGEMAALTAGLFRQVHRVEAHRDEFLPPGG